jgi:catechol 2,3-dioxygenase-like lactoylglutathione lyase family enzyme
MARLDHVAVPVSDMDAAIAFYRDKLGLELLSREIDPKEQEEFAFFEMDGGRLELLKNLAQPHRRPAIRPPYCPHVALRTDDMAATVRMIEERQLRLIKGPLILAGQATWLYVADPDNNIIEFVQWLDR